MYKKIIDTGFKFEEYDTSEFKTKSIYKSIVNKSIGDYLKERRLNKITFKITPVSTKFLPEHKFDPALPTPLMSTPFMTNPHMPVLIGGNNKKKLIKYIRKINDIVHNK